MEVIGGSARGRRAIIRRFRVVWRGRVAVLMAVARAGDSVGIDGDVGVDISGGGCGSGESDCGCRWIVEG